MSVVGEMMRQRLQDLETARVAEDKRRAELLTRGEVEDALEALAMEWESDVEEQAGIYTALSRVESMKAERGAALVAAARDIANTYAPSEDGCRIHIMPSHHLALVAALIAIDGGDAQ